MNLRILKEMAQCTDAEELNALRYIDRISNMNEVNTGAIESISHVMKGYFKDANMHLKEAKALYGKNENDKAIKELDIAISILKDARKEAEKIDDDGLLENILINAVLTAIPVIGQFAASANFIAGWYNLRKQSDKGDAYSVRHPNRTKNLALEFFFGKLRGAGYSRSNILAGYDKMLDECERLKKWIKRDKER